MLNHKSTILHRVGQGRDCGCAQKRKDNDVDEKFVHFQTRKSLQTAKNWLFRLNADSRLKCL